MFRVVFPDYDANVPTGCEAQAKKYSVSDRGGPKDATIVVSGPLDGLWQVVDWLGKATNIISPSGSVVWHGIVYEVEIDTGGYRAGVSLETVANKVAVTYSYRAADGSTAQTRTAYASDTDSQAVFGIFELVQSAGESTEAAATAQRDGLLADRAWPVGVPNIGKGSGSIATVKCRGLFEMLAHRYYSNEAGRIANTDNASSDISIGYQVSGAGRIGFRRAAIWDMDGQLGGFRTYDYVDVTGSTSNDTVWQVTGEAGDAGPNVVSNGISFDAPDDIYDTNVGFGVIDNNSWIWVDGSTSNDGAKWVKDWVGEDRITISPGQTGDLTTEAAGASITIYTGHKVDINANVTSEAPGSSGSVTLTLRGYRMAQSFTGHAMTTGTISISVGKTGTPSDNFLIELCADSSGSPGSVLSTVTIDIGDIYTDMQWTQFDMPAYTLSAGTTYWLVFRRSGSTDETNYYNLGLSTVPYGTTKAYNAAGSWEPMYWRDQKSVLFRIDDVEDTSTSIGRIVSQAGGNWLTDVSMPTTGVTHTQWVDRDTTAIDELVKLLDRGMASGERLVAVANATGVLSVTIAPSVDMDSAPVLHTDGKIYDAGGSPWEEGRLPVGVWLRMGGIPGSNTVRWGANPVYIKEASYDTVSGNIKLTPKSARGLSELLIAQ